MIITYIPDIAKASYPTQLQCTSWNVTVPMLITHLARQYVVQF